VSTQRCNYHVEPALLGQNNRATKEGDGIMKLCVVTLLGALTISCGGTAAHMAQVRTAAAPSASFSQYRTFAVGLTEAPPSGYQVSSRSLEAQMRIRPLIVAALEERGYTPQREGDRADLTVRFASETREAPVRNIAKNPDNHETILEGALIVDVFDSATGVQVWHGSAVTKVARDHLDEGLLATGVHELIGRFPDHAMLPSAERSRAVFPTGM
jgi:hypothetical protein